MKQFFLGIFLALSCLTSYAQIQVNPSVQWRIVRSQDLQLQNQSFYQFEFPAESGYDYVFNMFYDEADFITSLKVYDMQYKPIQSRVDSNSSKNTALEFRVSESGTYILLVSYDSPSNDLPKLEAQMTLVRRPEIE